MKLSIITPSYNQGKFIRQTIESVLSQNYHDFEYIVIDGGSTDGTIEILEEYSDQLIYVSEKDNGQSDAINKGFRMATGDVVAWINSDDTYEPGAFETVAKAFEQEPDVALIYGEGYIIDEAGEKLKRFENTIDFDLWMLINVWDYIMQPTTFFRRDALADVGYLNENLHWTMDWDLWLKLSQHYDVRYLNEYLANSREYPQTKTSTGGVKRLLEIRALTAQYAGCIFTKGFQLYWFDWMSKILPTAFLKKACIHVAVNILTNLPIPDDQRFCHAKLERCVRAFPVTVKLVFCIEMFEPQFLQIDVNGRNFCSDFLQMGDHIIECLVEPHYNTNNICISIPNVKPNIEKKYYCLKALELSCLPGGN